MVMRRLLIALVVSILAPACSPHQHNAVAGPTPLPPSSRRNIAAAAASAAAFPPRNEAFLFRTNLEAKYRDALRREPTSSFVDIEGSIVWTQEYLRYRVTQCGHADAVAKVLRQIDGFGIDADCGSTSTTTFPPRNEPLDFRVQLEQKYRDGLRRSPSATYVDVEGDIVWTLEYLRYRVSSCGHPDAESKVFQQIDDRSRIPPDCSVCAGPPSTPGFVGWTTSDVPAGSVRITWEPATGAVTSYSVELGTTIGGTNLGIVDVGDGARSYTFSRLSAGDYHARVRARNQCGVSGPSNEANPRVR